MPKIGIVFSAFGRLVTIWSYDPESLDRYPVVEIVTVLECTGSPNVPGTALHEPYDGRHDVGAGFRWMDRFFGYI